MPSYRIYRMKQASREHFRWAPHVSGAAAVKRKDYEEDVQVDAASDYALWHEMRGSARPLDIGDLLETDTGALRICKYIGFEAAEWVLPPEQPGAPAEAVQPPEAGVQSGPPPGESAVGYTSPDRIRGD
jgi:hypothetical protein